MVTTEETLTQAIQQFVIERLSLAKVNCLRSVSGGCISQSFCVQTDRGQYFIKVNTEQSPAMFEAEALALKTLRATETIRVPEPLEVDAFGEEGSIFVMEYIALQPPTEQTQALLGEGLARLHQRQDHFEFGFMVDNTIGSTPQLNPWRQDWCSFFKEHRLKFQLDLAAKQYAHTDLMSQGERLLDHVDEFFSHISVQPSLLHGDLWQGNIAADMVGNPVIFDPASYYGHHEAELSIMDMFGGFTESFYQHYHSVLPPADGFDERQLLYKLYHYLNHLNLFGESYLETCISMLQTLNEIG